MLSSIWGSPDLGNLPYLEYDEVIDSGVHLDCKLVDLSIDSNRKPCVRDVQGMERLWPFGLSVCVSANTSG